MKKTTSPKSSGSKDRNAVSNPSNLITARIGELGDWRGEMLARLRALIHDAEPEVVETFKWDVPVWERHGIICTGETYKDKVKLTFAKGAAVADPAHLFNSSLEGKTRRAIDFREGEAINENAFKALIKAAVQVNGPEKSKLKSKAKPMGKA